MNRVGARVPRPAHHRRLAAAARVHDAASSAPRGLHLDDRHVRDATARGFSASIVDAALYVVNNHARLRERRLVGRALSAEDPDGGGSGALERHPVGARSAPAACRSARSRPTCSSSSSRPCFQLMEIRAALGRALRRLQHRPVGLHQQRLGRDGVGSDVRQPEHRRHHDDLRLHADATRIACAAPSTRPMRPASSRCGRAAWSRTFPVGSAEGVAGEHEARRGRRRARAARRRQRQVGRPLEDGPHRPSGVGEGGRGQPARSARSRR